VSIPIAHFVYLKETYENLHLMLEKVQYPLYKWIVCCDLKVATYTKLFASYSLLCVHNIIVSNKYLKIFKVSTRGVVVKHFGGNPSKLITYNS